MRALAALTWVETKLFAREPLTVVFVLVLPVVVLYVLNGVFGGRPASAEVWEGLPAIDFYTPAYVALVAATAGVLSLPVHLAGYRERGVLRRFRASALPSGALAVAHMVVTALIASCGALLLGAVSVLVYDATVPRSWLGVVGAYLLVVAAFSALGTLLGLLIPTARAAQAVGVILFFVFLMLGGSGPPREVLPETMGRVGDVLPATHAGRLLRGPWLGEGWDVGALGVVAAVVAVSAALTVWRLRSQE